MARVKRAVNAHKKRRVVLERIAAVHRGDRGDVVGQRAAGVPGVGGEQLGEQGAQGPEDQPEDEEPEGQGEEHLAVGTAQQPRHGQPEGGDDHVEADHGLAPTPPLGEHRADHVADDQQQHRADHQQQELRAAEAEPGDEGGGVEGLAGLLRGGPGGVLGGGGGAVGEGEGGEEVEGDVVGHGGDRPDDHGLPGAAQHLEGDVPRARRQVQDAAAGRDVRVVRDDLEVVFGEPVYASVELIRDAVRGAGLELGDVSQVLLVGGGAAIPLVAELISSELGFTVVAAPQPAQTSARGAALLAADLVRASTVVVVPEAAAAPAPKRAALAVSAPPSAPRAAVSASAAARGAPRRNSAVAKLSRSAAKVSASA